MPRDRPLRRLRDRHEPRGRDHAARRAWCDRTSRSSPRSRPSTSSISTASTRSPTPRPRSSRACVPGGVAIINRDIATFDRLRAHAAASPARHMLTFGEHRGGGRPPTGDHAARRGLADQGRDPGPHARFSARRARQASGHQRPRRAARRARLRRRPRGGCRGPRPFQRRQGPGRAQSRLRRRGRHVHAHRRKLQRQPGLDARRPGAARCCGPGSPGRRIAVLGDMRELGPRGAATAR